MGLSLYSTRLVLKALEIEDYGLYAVVGGVVAMLGFITNALIVTTQRYISYNYGRGDASYTKKVFANSFLLHVCFGVIMVALLFGLEKWLFAYVLNVNPLRLLTAIQVYHVTAIILFVTIVTAPFKALLIARENIIYISFIDVCDGLVKLLLALFLLHVSSDRLIYYAYMMLGIQFINLVAFSGYAVLRYDECSVVVHRKDIDKDILRQLVGFAGWTCYGAGAVAFRNQGTAVVMNHFWGTAINAAYGIAMQVYGAIAFIVSSLLNAMNPQIMKAEGQNDRQHALSLAMKQSKFSTAILSIVAIPVIVEIPSILVFWLDEVPPHTAMFCSLILLSFICDQMTLGLNAANQATGKIRTYTLLTYTPKLLYLPVIWLLLKQGCTPVDIMIFYTFIEIFVAVIRLPYSSVRLGLSIKSYCAKVLLPLLPLFLISVTVCFGCVNLLHFPFRFLLTFLIGGLSGVIAIWFSVFSAQERGYALKIIKKKIS